MNICKVCGYELSEDVKICPECSFRFAPDNQHAKHCPSCYEEISAEDDNCKNCGFTFPAAVHSTKDTEKFTLKLAEEYSRSHTIPYHKGVYFEKAAKKYKSDLSEKDSTIKSLRAELNTLSYDFQIQKAQLHEKQRELQEKDEIINKLTEITDSAQQTTADELDAMRDKLIVIIEENSTLCSRATQAERDRNRYSLQLGYVAEYTRALDIVVLCIALCANQVWALEFPHSRIAAYLSVLISCCVFHGGVNILTNSYGITLFNGWKPRALLSVTWIILLFATFRTGVYSIVHAAMIGLTFATAFLSAFVYKSNYHSVSQDFIFASYAPAFGIAVIATAYYMLCSTPSVLTIFGT